MTLKAEFLDALRARMAPLPEHRRDRLLACFEEMIDDRIEMGMAEADAVSALGDPEALLRDHCPELLSPAEEPALPAVRAADEGMDWREPVREVHLHLKNADGRVVREALPGGMTAQIRASQPGCFTWRLADGVLTVAEADGPRRGLFRSSAEVTLALADLDPEVLIADSYGGDLSVEGIRTTTRLVLAASSGDIELQHVACEGRLEASTRSGDIALDAVEALADCKLETLSGDVSFERVRAARFRVRTASGDIEGRGLTAGSVALGATSGDVEATDIDAEAALLCETTEGDVSLKRVAAPDIRVNTTAGDVRLGLAARAEGYNIRAESRVGDVRLPDCAAGKAAVRVTTASGDIHVTLS